MALYVDLSGAQRSDVDVLVSPLAELVATLHVLAELDHHPEAGDWADELGAALSPALRDRLRLFDPLWARHRCRLFFPLGRRRALPLTGELDLLGEVDTEQFLLLSAAAVLGTGLSKLDGLTGGDLLRDGDAREAFALRCARRSFSRGELARVLVSDPLAFRDRLLALLRDCDQAFFGRWWPDGSRQIELSARRLERDLGHRDLVDVLAKISPTARRVSDTRRVRFDKLQPVDVAVAERRLILVPSQRSWPHLIVKPEKPWPAVLQYMVEGADGSPLTQMALHDRLAALATPSNLEICRHLAGEAITTSELSAKLGRSRPEISRSLAHLRAVDLVVSERDGKYIYHRLDFATIMRLGPDFLATVTR